MIRQQQQHMAMAQQHQLSPSHDSTSASGVLSIGVTGTPTHYISQQSINQQQQQGSGTDEAPIEQQQQPSQTIPQQCIRSGCPNAAIINSDWEDEYCSNECVVTHCRDVFSKWMQGNSNPQQATYPAAK